MPDRIKVDGIWYDAENAPPWWEHWVPGGLHLTRTMETARANAIWNKKGNDISNAILWGILTMIAGCLIALAVIASKIFG